jgi:hypothetical protein
MHCYKLLHIVVTKQHFLMYSSGHGRTKHTSNSIQKHTNHKGTIMSNEVVTFNAYTVAKGKSPAKLAHAIAQGADAGALLAIGKHRKAIITTLAHAGEEATITALSHGNIRPACAALTDLSGKAVTLMEIDGKAPYSEFLRMGAALAQFPQLTKTGKPTSAAKALAKFTEWRDAASAIRAERMAAKALPKVDITSKELSASYFVGPSTPAQS